jgi:hypothetical protein
MRTASKISPPGRSPRCRCERIASVAVRSTARTGASAQSAVRQAAVMVVLACPLIMSCLRSVTYVAVMVSLLLAAAVVPRSSVAQCCAPAAQS